MNYRMWFVTLYRRQGSRPSPWADVRTRPVWLLVSKEGKMPKKKKKDWCKKEGRELPGMGKTTKSIKKHHRFS